MTEQIKSNRGGRVDFVTGAPWKTLLMFAVPLMFGNLFQQLYNVVGGIIVGRGVSHIGLAAVGISGPFMRVLTSAFMGIAMGGNVLVAQTYGAKDIPRLRKIIHTAIVLAIAVGAVMSVGGVLLAPFILRSIGVEEELYPMALTYMQITFGGIVFQMLYNMVASFIRGIGDSRKPVTILVITSVVNAVLTWIFVIIFKWSVAGSAWAMVISQLVSVVLVFRFMLKNPATAVSLKELRIDRQALKDLLTIGIPTCVQQVAMSIGGTVVMGFVTPFGTATIAGYTTAQRIDMFALMPMQSLGMSITPYAASNVGAGRMDRVMLGLKQGLGLSMGINAVLCAIVMLLPGELMWLFTDNAETISEGVRMLHVITPTMLLMGLNQPMAGVIRGSGDSVTPMKNALLMVLIVRIPAIYLLMSIRNTVDMVYWSQMIAYIAAMIHLLIVYRRGKWKERAIKRTEYIQSGAAGQQRADP